VLGALRASRTHYASAPLPLKRAHGSERRRLAQVVQFRASTAEKRALEERALEAGFRSSADYLRSLALGPDAELRRPRTIEIPLTAPERAIVGRRAERDGFTDAVAYARARLLDRDLEGMTISRAIMELRRMTGLQKHLFNNDQLRSREYAELVLGLGVALENVCAVADRFARAPRRTTDA